MPATPESKERTRIFARAIGPFLAILAVVLLRLPEMNWPAEAFFSNPALVWITGALLLLCGLFIIAIHQYWSSPAAIAVSLFGWLTGLKGLALLIAPEWLARATEGAMASPGPVRAGFGLLTLIGLGLTWEGWRASRSEPSEKPAKRTSAAQRKKR